MSMITIPKAELDKLESAVKERDAFIKDLQGVIKDQMKAVDLAKGGMLCNNIQLRKIEIQYAEFLAEINRKVGRGGAVDPVMENLKAGLADLERNWQKFREESPDAAKAITGLEV